MQIFCLIQAKLTGKCGKNWTQCWLQANLGNPKPKLSKISKPKTLPDMFRPFWMSSDEFGWLQNVFVVCTTYFAGGIQKVSWCKKTYLMKKANMVNVKWSQPIDVGIWCSQINRLWPLNNFFVQEGNLTKKMICHWKLAGW